MLLVIGFLKWHLKVQFISILETNWINRFLSMPSWTDSKHVTSLCKLTNHKDIRSTRSDLETTVIRVRVITLGKNQRCVACSWLVFFSWEDHAPWLIYVYLQAIVRAQPWRHIGTRTWKPHFTYLSVSIAIATSTQFLPLNLKSFAQLEFSVASCLS